MHSTQAAVVGNEGRGPLLEGSRDVQRTGFVRPMRCTESCCPSCYLATHVDDLQVGKIQQQRFALSCDGFLAKLKWPNSNLHQQQHGGDSPNLSPLNGLQDRCGQGLIDRVSFKLVDKDGGIQPNDAVALLWRK